MTMRSAHFKEVFFFLISVTSGAVDLCEVDQPCLPGSCGPGEYFLRKTGACLPCGSNTFMDRSNHSCLCCKACSVAVKGAGQVRTRSCSPVSDAVIGCETGYALLPPRTCVPCGGGGTCTEEQQVRRVCGTNGDTAKCYIQSQESNELRKSMMSPSSIIVGSIAGSLILIGIIVGTAIYYKTKNKYRKDFVPVFV